VLGALRVRRYGFDTVGIVRVDDVGEVFIRLHHRLMSYGIDKRLKMLSQGLDQIAGYLTELAACGPGDLVRASELFATSLASTGLRALLKGAAPIRRTARCSSPASPRGRPGRVACVRRAPATSPANAWRLLDEFSNIDVSDLAPKVTAPTLILAGRREPDGVFEQSRILASLIPGSRLVSLDTANHLLPERDAAWPQFLAEIDAFLAPPTS
jgi:pimeloyl-ACP methyl ester carboxylesterase